jgi:glycosyltransferase involved in cell wall biosynthesis
LGHAVAALEGFLLRRADRIAVVSDSFLPYLGTVGIRESDVTLFRNWTRMPTPRSNRDERRRALGWSPNETIVLHAGNMGFKQALENVVNAARLSMTAAPNLRFVLMGDGNQKTLLKQQAAGLTNLIFAEPHYDQEYADTLAAADVLLVNERSSVGDMSLPSKLTSYFVAGRPVVAATATNSSTARELERSRAGIVVPPEDPATLLDALQAIANDTAHAAQLTDAAKAFAAEHLDAHKALQVGVDWVEEVASIRTSRNRPRGRRENLE